MQRHSFPETVGISGVCVRGGQRASGGEEVNEGWVKSWPEKVGLEKEGWDVKRGLRR